MKDNARSLFAVRWCGFAGSLVLIRGSRFASPCGFERNPGLAGLNWRSHATRPAREAAPPAAEVGRRQALAGAAPAAALEPASAVARLVEPFCGGLAVALGLKPRRRC